MTLRTRGCSGVTGGRLKRRGSLCFYMISNFRFENGCNSEMFKFQEILFCFNKKLLFVQFEPCLILSDLLTRGYLVVGFFVES